MMPIHHTQRTQRQRAERDVPVGNTRQSRATANTIPAASTLPVSATAVDAGNGETPVAYTRYSPALAHSRPHVPNPRKIHPMASRFGAG